MRSLLNVFAVFQILPFFGNCLVCQHGTSTTATLPGAEPVTNSSIQPLTCPNGYYCHLYEVDVTYSSAPTGTGEFTNCAQGNGSKKSNHL